MGQRLVKCDCGAQVNPETRWDYGYYSPGTSDTFVRRGEIPEGHCPICRRALRTQPEVKSHD